MPVSCTGRIWAHREGYNTKRRNLRVMRVVFYSRACVDGTLGGVSLIYSLGHCDPDVARRDCVVERTSTRLSVKRGVFACTKYEPRRGFEVVHVYSLCHRSSPKIYCILAPRRREESTNSKDLYSHQTPISWMSNAQVRLAPLWNVCSWSVHSNSFS